MHLTTNSLKHISRRLATVAFAVAGTTALWAQTPDCNTFSHDSTMNALDHVLQRPMPSRKFENKRFGDRLFLSVEAGPDWMRTNDGLIGGHPGSAGYRAAITIGDWMTPVHGWRLSLGGGRHHGVDDTKPFFGSIALDYMMNFSSLLRADNPSRRFELIGLIGIEGEALHRRGHKLWASGGLRIGLQPRVYLNNSTFLYIEPRIGVFTDGLDDVKTWHRYDWNASLMIGLGYRLNGGRGHRVDNSLWINDCFRDNMFVGFSGGASLLGSSTSQFRSRLGVNGGVFIGKWFTPASGLRLQASGVELKEPGYSRRWAGLVDIDYMWNLNSTMNGYEPDRAIEANIIMGLSGAYTTQSGTKIYPGFHLGAQGVWNVSPSVGLFIEPSVRGFARSFASSRSNRITLLSSINLGLVYRFRGTEAYRRYRSSFDRKEFDSSSRYFFEADGGVFMRFKKWEPNFKIRGSFGKWFSPESAWRVIAEYSQMGHDKPYRSVTVGGDYILSLFSLASGFDATRPFDLDLFAGLRGGIAHYNGGKNAFVFGADAGIRGRIRVSDNVDILLEPSINVMRIPDYNNRKFNPEASFLAGVSYRIGRQSSGSSKSSSPIDDTDNFVNFSIGPNFFSETMLGHINDFTWSMDLAGGHWFNNISGLQAGVSYEMLHRKSARSLYVGFFHVDYMLNLTGLFTGERARRFSISVFGGPGIGWSNLSDYASLVGHAGVGARFRMTSNLDFTLRPTFSVWQPRLEPGSKNNHHFVGTGSFPLGISYKF